MAEHYEPPSRGRPGEFGDLSPFTTKQTNYLAVTDTPVHCFPVTLGGEIIGYVWASDTADAAGFRARPGTGAIGFDAGGWWRSRLRRSWEKGTAPLDAVREWVGAPEDPQCGRIPADAEVTVIPDSESVHILAGRKPEKGDGK